MVPFIDLHPWIKTMFPIFEGFQKEAYKTVFNMRGYATKEYWVAVKENCFQDPPEPHHVESLFGLLKQGFFPKNLMREIYDTTTTKEVTFNETIQTMERERVVFISDDKDKEHTVFVRRQTWYYVPSFCTENGGGKEKGKKWSSSSPFLSPGV